VRLAPTLPAARVECVSVEVEKFRFDGVTIES